MPIDILVVLGSKEYAVKRLSRYGVTEEYLGNWVGMVTESRDKSGQGFYIIWVSEKPLTLDWHDTLAHEASHVIDLIFTNHSIEESGEVRAILMGEIVRQVIAIGAKVKRRYPR